MVAASRRADAVILEPVLLREWRKRADNLFPVSYTLYPTTVKVGFVPCPTRHPARVARTTITVPD